MHGIQISGVSGESPLEKERSEENAQYGDHDDHGSGRDLSQGPNGSAPEGCMPDGQAFPP